MISTHTLPEKAFTALAAGEGDRAVIRRLRQAQQSKHTMLLYAIAQAARDTTPATAVTAAFQAGYELLTRVQATGPSASTWLLGLPHLGGWLHDCLIHLDRGSVPDFGYLACAAGAAAVRAGIPFELEVPVGDGRILLPGLGCLLVARRGPWICLRSDGERLAVGRRLELATSGLGPDRGAGPPVPHWRGTPAVRAVAGGLAWDVLLETDDRYLDRYTLPMRTVLRDRELPYWRERVQSAWDVLVRYHRWTAEPLAEGISVIVPLTPQSDTDLISATSPAAFGAVATCLPPDPVTMAETLVHEFQHVKLCGLMDMMPLTTSGGEHVYAPWRQDPRPPGGLLQGVYAHLGITRFWRAQRHVETDPDDILRAQVQFARWHPTIDLSLRTLRQTGCLTPSGTRFVDLLQAQGAGQAPEPVPVEATELAEEAALDHRLTWQIRHLAVDATDVASLAAAYRRGEPAPPEGRPRTWIQEGIRKPGSDIRSRLLNMRYVAPARYREMCADGGLPVAEPDRLLLSRAAHAAVQAYRDQIASCADPQPGAWIGLALALHQLPPSPLQAPFATRLPLMFEVYTCLGNAGDPLNLAGWFA